MRTLLQLLFLFLYTFTCLGQTFEWVKTPPIHLTFNAELVSYGTLVDQNGAIYHCGFKDQQMAYSFIMGRLLLDKYNPDGTLLFSKTIHGKVHLERMMVDNSNNLYLLVSFIETISFGPFSLENTTQGLDYVLIKLDSAGEFLWHYEVSLPNSHVQDAIALAIDQQDKVYIGYDNYNTSYITKLSNSGIEEMTLIQDNVSIISSLAIDEDGNILAAGSCLNTNASFAGLTIESNFDYSVYLVKYSPTGIPQWVKVQEDITCINPIVVAKGIDEIYWANHAVFPMTFGTHSIIGPEENTFGLDFFLTRVNHQGEYQWVREVPGAGGVHLGGQQFLALDNQGNIYFTGSHLGPSIVWENNHIVPATAHAGHRQVIVFKFNPQGVIQGFVNAGGNLYNKGDSVAIGSDGSIFLTGIIRGNAQFGELSYQAEGDFDFATFLAKINQETLSSSTPNQQPFEIYPNPTQDKIFWTSTIDVNQVRAFSLDGKMLKLPHQNGLCLTGVLAKGVYIFEFDSTEGIIRKKVVKN
jgi:outer membrane protein assembly factor BamB